MGLSRLTGVLMSGHVELILARRLRHRRRALGITQGELGAACGVRFQQIQKYECGANRVSASMLWKLACALDVEVSYFFNGVNPEPDPPRAIIANFGGVAS